MLFDQLLGTCHDIPGLSVEKAAGVDVFTDFLWVSLGKALQRREAAVESRCHLIDPFVGALGRQTHGEEQFVIFFILQRTKRVWINPFQRFNNAAHSGF